MHLTSYPKLVRSELRLDAVAVQTLTQQSSLFVRTYSSNHGNISSSRLPLSVISTNTLSRSDATDGGAAAVLRLRPPPPGHDPAAANDADIWTVIKPGHVREKIAIFASDEGRTDAGGGEGEHCLTGGRERATACTNAAAAASCLLRAGKAKGVWEENGSAKRRRRSGNNQVVQQDQRTWVLDTQPQDAAERGGGGGGTAAEDEQKVSVVEMVAYLEQRVSERRPDAKPLLGLQRSSTTITLSRTLPPEAREGSEVRGEEPESVKVSDMVAKLECLRRRTEGDLSRSNSLRRTVGRVLLAAGDRSPAPGRSLSTSSVTSLTAALPGAQSTDREPISCSETLAPALTPPPSPDPTPGEAATGAQEALTPPPAPEEAEPLPGLLFLSCAASETTTPTQSESGAESAVQSEKRRRRRRADSSQGEELGGVLAVAGRRASVSQDFLEMRQRLQQLLEPQPYLSVLPHHLLLKILLLLPTQTLAALKCTCRYFRFVIDNYGVRPADSLWVSDPRYRDDPCKQCKKRYGRGDVSLCRWHHKPYCQALPYGPGYWMCCHGAHRDTPGCNVGLHDNRWVPAFHSINVPIYRRNRSDD